MALRKRVCLIAIARGAESDGRPALLQLVQSGSAATVDRNRYRPGMSSSAEEECVTALPLFSHSGSSLLPEDTYS